MAMPGGGGFSSTQSAMRSWKTCRRVVSARMPMTIELTVQLMKTSPTQARPT